MGKRLNNKSNKEIEDACTRYLKLSKYLFSFGDNGIYDINEMPKGSPFFDDANKLAKSLNIDWVNMNHEESNRIMLALLQDYYCQMKAGKNVVLTYNIKIVKD